MSDFATPFLLVYQVAAAQVHAHPLLYSLALRKQEGENTCQEEKSTGASRNVPGKTLFHPSPCRHAGTQVPYLSGSR